MTNRCFNCSHDRSEHSDSGAVCMMFNPTPDGDECPCPCRGFHIVIDDSKPNMGEVSDGYHTFNELYDHRITLFIALCRFAVKRGHCVWRSKLHSDDTWMQGWFIVGVGTVPGTQITYHVPLERWAETDFITEWPRAPTFDGHTSGDVLARLKTLGEDP